ncbi:WYL domain-containing protein [Lutibacter sp. HS1-25]|uniref:helix-turn-helix transcriptional regulator n=1 Tax=Lutibacter sp. HS1-25 TaxID=2485000 RepID=UPI0010125458|nr:WYL domain-containing protein [Lutibacter sp. HS1-25]RXP60869.1 WYL domain-containing protein [Lutibacter sp. HS1-25]
MSKKEYINRYLLLVKRVERGDYPSYQNLVDYVNENAYLLPDNNLQVGFSQRTLNRDINDIREVFGVDILHSSKEKGYFIVNEDYSRPNFIEMLETFEVLKLSQFQNKIKDVVFFEQKQSKGTEYLKPIIYAITHRKKIKIRYEKYWEGATKVKLLEPYALKEIQNRWYLIAKNNKNYIAPYALDRIKEISIEKSADYILPDNFDVSELYQYNYGISIDNDLKPEKVILTTDTIQAKYLESLPIHSSQKIIEETDSNVVFQLDLKLGDELVYKLLSYGDRITIKQPVELINMIIEKLKILNKRYEY